MSWIVDLKIAVKISLAFLIVSFVSITMSDISLRNIDTIEKISAWTEHTHNVISQMEIFAMSMIDHETGLLGFVVTADESFLDPYKAGRQAYAIALTEVRSLTSDNQQQQERLVNLEKLATHWCGTVADPEIAFMRDPTTHSEARRMVISGVSKKTMDVLSAKAAEIVAIEAPLLTVRSAAAKAAADS